MAKNEEKLTPSVILEMFAKSKIEADKRAAEADKRAAEWDKRMAEWDKKMAESAATSEKEWKEIRQQMKEVRKEIGGIGESNGKMAEEAIFNALEQNMMFAGINFEYIERNTKRKKKSLNLEAEIDVLLVNGSMLAMIETKYRVKHKDVLKLTTDKLGDFKKLFPEYNNHKIILGVGGMSFEDDAFATAKENGIGIIKISGDTVEYYTENLKIY